MQSLRTATYTAARVATLAVVLMVTWLTVAGLGQTDRPSNLGVAVFDAEVSGPEATDNFTDCLFSEDGVNADAVIVGCLAAAFSGDLTSCGTAATTVIEAARNSGSSRAVYPSFIVFSESTVEEQAESVVITFLTGDNITDGVFAEFIFRSGTTDASANIERIVSFYQAISDRASDRGEPILFGVALDTSDCAAPEGDPPDGILYTEDNASSLAARLVTVSGGVAFALFNTLPDEGGRCGFVAERLASNSDYEPNFIGETCGSFADDDSDYNFLSFGSIVDPPDSAGIVGQLSAAAAALCALAVLLL